MFNPILERLELDQDRIIITPGNHDVHRKQEIPAIESYFQLHINSNDSLNEFVSDNSQEMYEGSCRNMQNYINFAKKNYYSSTDDILTPLYGVHRRRIADADIGIITFNSAWRAISDSSKNRLLYPTGLMSEIVEQVKDADIKIAMLHHNLASFQDFNRIEIENCLHHSFDLLFHGHTHLSKISIVFTFGDGILTCCSPATMSHKKDHTPLGFTVLDVDKDDFSVSFQEVTIDRGNRVCTAHDKRLAVIPRDKEKTKQNDFRRRIRLKYQTELTKANDLLVIEVEDDDDPDFLSLFVKPVLTTKPRTEIEHASRAENLFDLNELVDSEKSTLILGKVKSGRTSLLRYMQLTLLKEYSTHHMLPYYIDYEEYRLSGRALNLESDIARYYAVSKSRLMKSLQQNKLLILLDNFDPYAERFNNEVFSYIDTVDCSRFVACTDETIIRMHDPISLRKIEIDKLYINDIKRTEVRSLTVKWPSLTPERREIVMEKITKVFHQMHIPFNFWTVSLFLWIFSKTSKSQIESNFALIELYIDEILEKRRLALDSSSELTFPSLKAFLASLAGYLVEKKYHDVYSLTYDELIDFIRVYRKDNIRFVCRTELLINTIMERGILCKYGKDKYTFRLKGVFEYFIAYHMKMTPQFRDAILEDQHFFLSFGTELELYSGFERNDDAFLGKILRRGESLFKEVNEKFKAQGSTDENLTERYRTLLISQIAWQEREAPNPLPVSKQDEILESLTPMQESNGDVEKKKYYEVIDCCTDNLQKMLSIVSGVFRNSEGITDRDLLNETLDFLLDSYCNFGMLLIDEYDSKGRSLGGNDELDPDYLLLKNITNFIPLTVQVLLSEGIGHPTISRLVEEKIDELKVNIEGNQYKLMLLYHLLVDIDIEANYCLIDEMLTLVNIKALRSSTLLKMYYLLMFKCAKNSELESKLKLSIRSLARDLDDKKKKDEIQSGISSYRKKIDDERGQIAT